MEVQTAAEYPSHRPANYVCRFARKLFKTHAVYDVETKGLVLLILIASLEDEKGLCSAIRLADSQIMATLGISLESLNLVRQKCVVHGWLHFEPGRGSASRYWTLVPPPDIGRSFRQILRTPSETTF